MTNREFERKVNLRLIKHAIFNVSMAINGLGVVEAEALACEDPLSEPMSASIADMGSKLRNVLTTLNEVRESLEGERMPIEFSEEKLLNNEWMDLDTEVMVPMSEKCDPKFVITGKTEPERAHERMESFLRAMESAPKVTDESHGDDFAPNVINDTVVGLKNVVRDPIGSPAPNFDEEFSRMSWERATRVDPCHDRPITTIGQRVIQLEKDMRTLSEAVGSLNDTIASCFAYMKLIEAIDRDTMRLVGMYVGYSEGE